MTIETIRMSSKGQVVIPLDIREEIDASEGTVFAVMGGKDSVILKKVKTPSKDELIKELNNIAAAGAKKAERLKIKEEDVPNMIHKLRQEKRK